MATKTLLFIEDEYLEMEDFVSALKEEGYDVETASDGGEAIQLLSKKRYDIVLLDIMMSHGDEMSSSIPGRRTGIEILKMIRTGKLEPSIDRDTPVVVLTGLGNSREITDIQKLDVNELIQKPIAPDRLAIIIDDTLTASFSRKH